MAKRRQTFSHVHRIEVYLWGERVGAVALDPGYGFYAFRYTPEFQASGIEPAPLHMPTAVDRTFLFTDLPVATYKRLPAMLSDALPDDFGNALIDRWMLDHGVQREAITSLDRLAYMSTRSMGALTFRPPRGTNIKPAAAVQMGELVEAARKALRGEFEDDSITQQALQHIIDVGTSAGGARPKAVIAWNRKTGEIRSGQMDCPEGFEHWLLKFDGVGKDFELGASKDYGRIEYAYYLMARAAGMSISESRLLEENGRAHFMTRRFDRDGDTERHHVQTLCALAHLDYKKKATNSYSQLFDVMNQLGLTYEEREEAFRRMTFNVMARNCDDHTKNVSFRMKRGEGWTLAPAYDITFAHNQNGEWTSQHLMAVNEKFKDFTAQDLLAVADRFGIGTAKRVIEQVYEAVIRWPEFADQAKVSEAEVAKITDSLLPIRPGARRRDLAESRELSAETANADEDEQDKEPNEPQVDLAR